MVLNIGNRSKVLNKVDDEFRQTISQSLQNVVDLSSRASCNQIQDVIGVENCDITFGKQVCEASILAQTTASNTLEAEAIQSMYSKLKQEATASQDFEWGGFNMGNTTSTSNITRRQVEMATDITMAMKTDCVRDIQLVNAQRVVNSKNCKVNFADQVVTAEIIADCAVNSAGRSKALQDLTVITEQKGEATIKSGGIFSMLLMLLMIPLMLFLVPAALGKGIQVATGSPKKPLIPGFVKFLLFLLILALGLWYPGAGAWYFGIPPWPYPYNSGVDQDGNPICVKGKSNTENIINKLAWFDKHCVAKHNGRCSSDKDKLVHYDTCGIFSGLCSDSQAEKDIDSFIEANKICAALPSNLISCTANSVAQKMIPQNVKSGDASAYPGCKLCSNVKSPAYGLFINANSKCDENTQVTKKKFVAYSKYWDTENRKIENNMVMDDQDMVQNSCNLSTDLGRAHLCVPSSAETWKEMAELGKDECMNVEYQNKKRAYVHVMDDCDKLQDLMVSVGRERSTVDKPIQLSYQCPPRVEDFMTKCEKNGTCDYTPNNSDPESVEYRACKNSFEGCLDEEYVADKTQADAFKTECQNLYNGWKGRRDAILGGTISVYVLIIFLILFMTYRSIKGRDAAHAVPPYPH